MNTNKAIFLDRDGVLNKIVFHDGIKKPSSPWVYSEFEPYDYINEALLNLKDMGYLLFVITNQPDIARGNIEKGVSNKINHFLINNFPIDEIYICGHDNIDICNCR